MGCRYSCGTRDIEVVSAHVSLAANLWLQASVAEASSLVTSLAGKLESIGVPAVGVATGMTADGC